MIKKKLVILSLFLILIISFIYKIPVHAEGEDTFEPSMIAQIDALAGEEGADYGTAVDPKMFVVDIIKLTLGFVGIIFLAIIFYAGYLWIISAGEEEKIKKAQNMIKSAIIGVIVVFTSYGITLFVQKYLYEAGSMTESSDTFDTGWVGEEDMDEYYNYNRDPMGGSTAINVWGDEMTTDW